MLVFAKHEATFLNSEREAFLGGMMAPKEKERTPERMVAFSDAIFAFAITLLAFNIKVPDVPGGLSSVELVAWMATLLPTILIYALSFWVIANFWVAHHQIFERIRRLDDQLIWMNLAYLFVISLLPFPTAVLVDYGDTSVAPMLYAFSMALAGLLLLRMWLHAVKYQHLEAGVSPVEIRHRAAHSFASAGVFIVSIPIAIFSPTLAELSWLLIFLAKPLSHRYVSQAEQAN